MSKQITRGSRIAIFEDHADTACLMTVRCADRILLRDARWSTIERGTAKIGIITSGKEPMRTFGASREKIWRRLGALKNPVATAIKKSMIPKQFQRATSGSFSLRAARAPT